MTREQSQMLRRVVRLLAHLTLMSRAQMASLLESTGDVGIDERLSLGGLLAYEAAR
jgi:hypothetical protein